MPDQIGTKPFVGVLMLDTAFPRVLGDAGNVESYPFPVKITTVSGASAREIVRPGRPDDWLLTDFIAAALQLEAEGAIALISTCGFLVHFQEQLARAVKIPVMVSSLSLFPTLRHIVGHRPISIFTASATSLKNGALKAADIQAGQVQIVGFEDCTAFADAILNSKATTTAEFDCKAIRAFAVERAQAMITQTPDIGCILLECGNLPPYAPAIRAATGVPVFSILDVAQMFWSASERQLFGAQ